MSKKHELLRDEPNRDKHPEREQAGSPLQERSSAKDEPENPDKQQGGTGKVANDHNKMGHQAPTQKNEGRRTPQSRHDRQTMGAGPQNQVSARKAGGGGGRGPRGAG